MNQLVLMGVSTSSPALGRGPPIQQECLFWDKPIPRATACINLLCRALPPPQAVFMTSAWSGQTAQSGRKLQCHLSAGRRRGLPEEVSGAGIPGGWPGRAPQGFVCREQGLYSNFLLGFPVTSSALHRCEHLQANLSINLPDDQRKLPTGRNKRKKEETWKS